MPIYVNIIRNAAYFYLYVDPLAVSASGQRLGVLKPGA
jgi:hypothetical protein